MERLGDRLVVYPELFRDPATAKPELARSLATLGSAAGAKRSSPLISFLVHRGSAAGLTTNALRPGVRAVSLPQLLAALT